MKNLYKIIGQIIVLTIFLTISACGIYKPVDARKVPPNVKDRVEKNLAEGKGFRLFDSERNMMRGGVFQFANSNELWKASLDVIDFMPLSSVNYSGGIIITDWYSDNKNPNESIKLTIRFLTNEIRSDALSIKVFYRTCKEINNCIINEKSGPLAKELTREILKIAAKYKSETDADNFREYIPQQDKDKN